MKKQTTTGKVMVKKSTPKKAGRKQIDPLGPAKVFVDRWEIDPTTGKRVRLTLHRLPGKGKIPLKVIQAAVRKVKLMEAARKKQTEMEAKASGEVGG